VKKLMLTIAVFALCAADASAAFPLVRHHRARIAKKFIAKHCVAVAPAPQVKK